MTKLSTPCVKVCVLEYGVCKGCKRTNRQIRDWHKYTEEQRKEIMERLNDQH